MFSTVFFMLTTMIGVFWSLVFLVALPLGFRLNKVEGPRMKKFLKTVKYSTIWTNDLPDGWIVGAWFIGYVQPDSSHSSRNLHIFSTKSFFDQHVKMIELDDDTGEPTKKTITYWSRQGTFRYIDYYSRHIDAPRMKCSPKQEELIDRVLGVFEEKKKAVCLIYGDPGGGKSMTSLLLCRKILEKRESVGLCDTHAPNEPGDNFDSFYTSADPSEDKPVVLVFEEVDGLVRKIHYGEVTQGEKIPVQIKNKTDWNSFLDKFDRGMYPGVILFMTTNRSPDYFDDLDSSYMRANRVDIKFRF
jgi:hypothetical protein